MQLEVIMQGTVICKTDLDIANATTAQLMEIVLDEQLRNNDYRLKLLDNQESGVLSRFQCNVRFVNRDEI